LKHLLGRMDRKFTSRAVASIAGVSLRQLQWWDEQGIVVPSREGRARSYSADDLAEIAVITEMRRKGFSLQRMRKVMRFLQRDPGRRLVDLLHDDGECHLLTDGKRIFVEDSAASIVDILKNARQPIFSVCLTDAVRRVQVEIMPARKMVPAAAGRGKAQRRRA
jgi:DNA-binding transcriptional MerR regulator